MHFQFGIFDSIESRTWRSHRLAAILSARPPSLSASSAFRCVDSINSYSLSSNDSAW